VERLRDSYPAWRIVGLFVYLGLAWPLYPDVEGYSRAGNIAQGVALALAVLAVTGTAFWLGAKWKGRPKTWTRATLSLGAMLTALVLAVLSLAGRNDEQEKTAGLTPLGTALNAGGCCHSEGAAPGRVVVVGVDGP